MGIQKLRITGGEPLIRRNVLFLYRELGKRQALREITLTTNGTMLTHYAEGLFDAGIKRINVSLDTLNRANYRRITGVDQIDTVIEGIKILQHLGITIKLNVVAMKGINDGEFTDFIRFSEQNNIEVRFIEVMPHMYSDTFTQNVFISTESIMQKIGRSYTLLPVSSNANNATARIYKIKHSDVKVGFISAVSLPFCSGCNKLRLMADGTLRTCLFSESGKNLKILLSQGNTDKEIINEIMAELSKKPQNHELNKDYSNLVMHRVGG
jgi:cyclic pyranopterin phosphate synthase